MAIAWKLKKVEGQLTKDLKETNLSFRRLGEKYGVSGQAIFSFCDGRRIKRPRRPKTEHTEKCPICKTLLRIARRPHSDFISLQTIKEALNIGDVKRLYHLRILREKGLISQKFGKLQSKKVERAYKLYFKKGLPVRSIERQVGLKNFHPVIGQHRAYGWNVPERFPK